MASLYEKDGDFDTAAKIHEKTLEINPDYIQGYALARMYFLQGKTDESINLYNKALKLLRTMPYYTSILLLRINKRKLRHVYLIQQESNRIRP